MNHSFNEINEALYGWAKDRNIISPNNSSKQLIKLGEEVGELCSAHLKGDKEKEIDSIGDVLVVLAIYCHQNNLTIVDCFNSAWNEIKDRKGRTENGTFIKAL